MQENDWGLTELGFRRPSYTEILDGFEYQAREKFTSDGKTPNLTVRSPLGMFLRIWAWITNLLFQLLEDVYNSQFIDTAVGNSLYQLGRIIGLKLLPAQRSAGYIQIAGSAGVTIPEGFLVGTISNIQYAVMTKGTIGDSGTVTLPIQCVDMGPMGNVHENSINQIINPVIGVQSVTNPKATDGGRDKETDAQFRDRYYKSVDFAGGVNVDAIRAEILQTAEGVLSAKVYENCSDYEDEFGLPPHSIEAVVYAGMDSDIANAIYRRKAAGIQTYGNTVCPVVSKENSETYDIWFTRPTAAVVWVEVSKVEIDKALFPIDGENKIKEALVNYIGGNITSGLGIGEDVIYNKLPCRIFGVSGVIDFDMYISADGLNYGKENIRIDNRMKAVTASDKITMEVLS